jgi:hypothetical protein
VGLRFEVNVATKLALKRCGSTFSDQLTFLESSRHVCRSRAWSSSRSEGFCVTSTGSGLLSLALKGLNASPILTDSGRYPRRFDIEPAAPPDDSLAAMSSVGRLEVSSAMPCRPVLLDSHFVVPSNVNVFFRIDRVSARLEGLPISWVEASDILGLVGESSSVGDVFGAVNDILLTMFLIIRGEDQPRSSLLRLEIANCEAVGVTGKGDFELRQSVLVSHASYWR